MKRITIILTIMIIAINNIYAIIDMNGNASTEFVLNYETGEVTNIEFDTLHEYKNYVKQNLNNSFTCVNDELGSTVEWNINNALFSNYLYSGYYSFVQHDRYYWDTGLERYPSEYCTNSFGEEYEADDSYSVPGYRFSFTPIEGKTVDDIQFTILEYETKEIGNYELIKYGEDKFDVRPRKIRSDAEAEPEFSPAEPNKIFKYSISSIPYVDNLIYSGFVNPETWELRALTHIKFYMSNAICLSRDVSSISSITEDSDYNESAPMYDLMGRRITSPAKGHIYIQNGKKFIGQSATRN
jgi:hypothetical protein